MDPLRHSTLPDGIRSRMVPGVNGLAMHVLEAGEAGRPALLLLHGFPELAFSWRRVMLPLAMLVGAYIFLRGHNQPGGGFIAALVVSIALIMQYMASGFGWAAHRVKVNYHAMIGAGVLVAAATGVAAMVLDQPFLTSTFGHFHLPLVGEFELASAMAFDTGVFLTVVGAVMLALANLSRMGRWTNPHSINKTAMDVDPSTSLPKEHG